MTRLQFLQLLVASGLGLAQLPEDLYNRVLVSRLLGKWKGHLHFEKMPDGFPTDYFGTVEAKWSIGMHVEATIKVDAPQGGKPINARGVLGSRDGLAVDGTPTHELNSVFYWDGDSGYLPMKGELKKGQLLLDGDRVPKDPNGGHWRTSVDFKSRDEINITLLGLDREGESILKSDPIGYIKLTRQTESKT